jgi:UDP-N-acetylglucosamine--N-acetylmuramyl-(pentapeptide) pyrophosphoryl-undecaprenol N-acetylglucosamine transferase
MPGWDNVGVQTLLVANGGGHFEELRLLRDRLGVLPEDSTWVTWDTPQTRSLLGSEDRIYVDWSQPRDLRKAVGYSRVARNVLKQGNWGRVVSTGSIVAVPFITVARRHGLPCHYIESAARMTGPSLSARLLEHVPGVRFYSQSRSWVDHRKSWMFRGSVFDGFLPERSEPREIRRVVVTLGTSKYGFERLVNAIYAVLPESVEVTWQIGSTTPPHPDIKGHVQMPQGDLSAAMMEADLVIAHAGVGTALLAMAAGHCPILVPRRADYDEHVDNHQYELAEELSRSGLATSSEPEDITLDMLVANTARRVKLNDHPPRFVLDEQ